MSTALLVTRFYEYHWQGDPEAGEGPMVPVRALRRAQCWLRDVTHEALVDYLERHEAMATAHAETQRMPMALIDEASFPAEIAIAGGRGGEHPFASPYFWAPFTFHGA